MAAMTDLNVLWWGHCVQCASARGDKPARVGACERIQKGDDGGNLLSSQHAVELGEAHCFYGFGQCRHAAIVEIGRCGCDVPQTRDAHQLRLRRA